ncbi:MAG: DNA-directed RNA polymerase subunit D [Candidatus ainarchaeum sp.]|nr:DNA-directed RNA polymerase subunit D [Candidatus ainarchaeum sp.]
MAISIKKIFEKENTSKFLVKGVTATAMNALRRSVMEEVPCLAIENVSIYANDSVMFDEFLAHRLGMLPIKTDAKGYKQGESVKLVLEKEGPCTVYSKDIKSTDPKVDVADKKIPITKLSKGQNLKIEMDAVMQTGKEHVKWQPAIIAYQEVASIETAKDCDGCEECIKKCPKNVLELKAKKIVLVDPFLCTICGACRDSCKQGALKINIEPETFLLMIETSGTLTAKECLLSAITALKNKSKEFDKAISKID